MRPRIPLVVAAVAAITVALVPGQAAAAPAATPLSSADGVRRAPAPRPRPAPRRRRPGPPRRDHRAPARRLAGPARALPVEGGRGAVRRRAGRRRRDRPDAVRVPGHRVLDLRELAHRPGRHRHPVHPDHPGRARLPDVRRAPLRQAEQRRGLRPPRRLQGPGQPGRQGLSEILGRQPLRRPDARHAERHAHRPRPGRPRDRRAVRRRRDRGRRDRHARRGGTQRVPAAGRRAQPDLHAQRVRVHRGRRDRPDLRRPVRQDGLGRGPGQRARRDRAWAPTPPRASSGTRWATTSSSSRASSTAR